MTRFFLYIFAALIVGQAVSIEFFEFLDMEEVQEVLEDLTEENDSEEESEVKDHFDRYASFWTLDRQNPVLLSEQVRSSNWLLESICLEIPSPPPDQV